ncbi:MAG TPA: adenylosuccinate lyase [Candidatus Omnitrophota bacterium]|nr:adenylosuccinate lyase [Candidatus Omnitrophota bacterium]HPN66143.1 adenylosuccinate lyase [Candidatus Omnitrophota bacterium]HRZ67701.1 adenylosuccinate lyase [Candidatus Omnitrophota bacterium]
MIERYTLPRMGKIWEDQNRFQRMLDVEITACEAFAKKKLMPGSALSEIKKRARFDVNRIKEIEKETKHDVIAFIKSISENVGPDAKYIHMGLTSSDVLDTGLSLQMRDAADIIIDDLKRFLIALERKAKKYKNTPCVGRTHGVHAEPMTFGLKFALIYAETQRNIERMKAARAAVSVGKLSGAVGTFANVDPWVEEYVCKRLKLEPAPVATQVIQRDRHAQFLSTIAIIGGTLEKFATEVRALQRTEVLEAEEPFTEGQKGSSAMPHKRNPVICERIAGLARVLRGNALASMENISLWHERDISHSSVERVILPDSCILIDYMLNLATDVAMHMAVYPERMIENLDRMKGLVFSQRVLLALIGKGVTRNEAYDLVQRCAMRVWKENVGFSAALADDIEVTKYLAQEEIEACFDLGYYTKNVDRIYKRLGL